MKLVIVMGIEAHSQSIRTLFADHAVPVFSETPVSGFRLHTDREQKDNWFAHEHVQVYSHLVFAFVAAEKAQELMQAVKKLSSEIGDPNPIRAFQLSVDNSI